jgi:hypothetical protein
LWVDAAASALATFLPSRLRRASFFHYLPTSCLACSTKYASFMVFAAFQ